MEGLAQDLFLLCLNERNGRLRSSMANYGFAGAVLMHLADQRRVTLDGKKLIVNDTSTTGNDLQDEMLARLARAKKPRSVQSWVSSFASGIKKLPSKVAEPLVHDGVLAQDVKKFLGIFPMHYFLVRDPGRHSEVIERIRAILLQMREADPESVALIALGKSLGLVNRLFTREERKIAKPVLKELTSKDAMAQAVSGSIAAVQAAIAGAVAASTVAATSGSGGGS
ncbi:GPP34 family phosphoprotein [bacterium]|nr:GPP34 family phosphoprotein [bacterium]